MVILFLAALAFGIIAVIALAVMTNRRDGGKTTIRQKSLGTIPIALRVLRGLQGGHFLALDR